MSDRFVNPNSRCSSRSNEKKEGSLSKPQKISASKKAAKKAIASELDQERLELIAAMEKAEHSYLEMKEIGRTLEALYRDLFLPPES
jgi:hypothetical protein